MKSILFVMLLGLGSFTQPTTPQARAAAPDLTGEWVLDKSTASASGPRPIVCGLGCSIQLDRDSIKISTNDGRPAKTLALNGTEVRTPVKGGQFSAEIIETATIDAGSVVIVIKTVSASAQFETRARLTRAGSRLVIEGLVPGRSGDTSPVRFAYNLKK